MLNRLRLKATLGTALILGLLLLGLGVYLINTQERQLVENLRDHGNRIAALTARSSAEYIQRFSFFLMEDQAIAIEQSPHIVFCEIYDAQDTPLLQSGNIISEDHTGKRAASYGEGIMVVSQPIMAEDKQLGRVEIGLRLDSIEKTMQEKTEHMVLLFLFFTICVIALLNLFFNRFFIKPVLDIADGTQKIARRNFVTIEVNDRKDEIGMLARNFNDMSKSLAEFTLTLEDKVSQRTQALEQANADLLKAIDQAKSMARKAEEGTLAKSQFLASMSHEMRTPMNAVLGMGEILSTSDLNAEQRRYVSLLLESGNALLALIDDILDLSKIEAGEMVFENRPFILEEAVEKSFKVVAYSAHQKGLDLDYVIAPDVPSRLEGDPLRLQQILINLLGNGVKFTDKGSVLLTISMDSRDKAKGVLSFCVRDSGIGIEAGKLETLFEKFTQADASTTRRHGGTGLGLSICQLLCENLGGHIWIESKYGSGCSVFFSLPYTFEEPVDSAPSALSGNHFLLLDDREYADAALAQRLRKAGAHVETVPTLEAGLDRLDRDAHAGFLLLNSPLAGETWEKTSIPLIERGIPTDDIILLTPSNIAPTPPMRSFRAVLTRPATANDVEEAVSRSTVSAPQPTPPLAGEQTPGSHLDILLVEDSVANAMLIELYLKDSGHRLTVAGNGKEALAQFKERHFDIVFMDIEMPIMDGYECTRRLREWEAATGSEPVTVVALTAHALSEVRDRILTAGCDTFLTKPIARTRFLEILEG